ECVGIPPESTACGHVSDGGWTCDPGGGPNTHNAQAEQLEALLRLCCCRESHPRATMVVASELQTASFGQETQDTDAGTRERDASAASAACVRDRGISMPSASRRRADSSAST